MCWPTARRGVLAKAHPEKKRVNRIGLTVTKKIGGAVVRSRVKRILRAGYRALIKTAEIKTGHLIVIVARPAAVDAKSTDIEKDLAYAFEKLGLYA